ncbi:hypothetical protein JHK82_043643 [Glycine max]|nr:hypothetical protein JHK86_043529 [Glycine max]KAG4957809.1 hypothetical protein JHK85_044189 [Glycine max]KAG5106673.1 hypothetical protein JHK82_043643 [Glycine max]KAG5117598.1 hypothetical protein JHK84_043711 [Glycine max]
MVLSLLYTCTHEPESENFAARNAGVRVLLNFVDILSPNETELARLTGLPTESFEEITQAALKCHEMLCCGLGDPKNFDVATEIAVVGLFQNLIHFAHFAT